MPNPSPTRPKISADPKRQEQRSEYAESEAPPAMVILPKRDHAIAVDMIEEVEVPEDVRPFGHDTIQVDRKPRGFTVVQSSAAGDLRILAWRAGKRRFIVIRKVLCRGQQRTFRRSGVAAGFPDAPVTVDVRVHAPSADDEVLVHPGVKEPDRLCRP